MKPLHTNLLLTALYTTLTIFTWTTHVRAEVAPATAPAVFSSNASVNLIELEKEKERALTAIAGLKARYENTHAQFLQLLEEINREITSDDSLQGLYQAKALRESRLKTIQTSNIVSQDDIAQNVVQIVIYRSQIADRIEMIRGRTHGGIYPELSKAQLLASIDLQEEQAKLDSIQSRISQLH